MKKSFRKTLILHIFIVAIIPITIIGALTVYISIDSLKNEILKKNNLLAKSLSIQIEDYLDMKLEDLRNARDYLEKNDYLTKKQKQKFFNNLITHKHIIKNIKIQVLDRNGKVILVAPYNKSYLGTDFSGWEYYRRVIKLKIPYWESSFIEPEYELPTTALAVPYKDGIIIEYMELSILTSLVAEIKLGKRNFIAILNNAGTTIAHSDKSKVLLREWNEHIKIVNNIQSLKTFEVEHEGNDMLLFASPVKQTGWIIMLYEPIDELYKPIKTVIYTFIAGLLIIISLAIFMNIIQVKKISYHINSLIHVSKKIAKGHYSVQFPEKSYIEFVSVYNSLQKMSDRINDREKKIIESEERFKQISENIEDVFWLGTKKNKWQFLFVNRSFNKIWGISPDLLYKNSDAWFNQISANYKDKVKEKFYSFLETKDEYHDEFPLEFNHGNKKWISVRGFIFETEEKGELRVAGIAQDITEQKLLNDTLNTLFVSLSEKTGKELFDKITFEVCSWFEAESSILGVITNNKTIKALSMFNNGEYVDNYEYEMKGTPCENVLLGGGCIYPQGVSDIFPDDKELVNMKAEAYAGMPIQDKLGNPIGVLNVISKNIISKTNLWKDMLKFFAAKASAEIIRLKAVEELENTKVYLNNVLDSMPSLLIGIDNNGLVTNMNKMALNSCNLGSEQYVGEKFIKIFPSYEKYLTEIMNKINKNENFTQERIVEQLGESIFYKNISAYPLVIDGVQGAVIRIDDITQEETKEAQLRQAQKMESIGNLAGGLAHDFNNLLGGILGSMSLLKRILGRESIKENNTVDMCLETINTASVRAVDMIKQLLTFSRKHDIKLVPVDVNQSVRHVVKILENSIPKSVNLNVNYHSDDIIISSDQTQFEQVILNICINASHAMTIMRERSELEGGELNINIKPIIADKHFCNDHPDAEYNIKYSLLQISDTGVGIDPELRAKIFEPFFSTKKDQQGTGLGLSVVYNIIKQYNGFIDLYSESGIGTTFSIYFPELIKENAEAVNHDIIESVPTGSGMILVIDDEVIMRSTAKGILEECGYNVVLAENGIIGVQKYKELSSEIVAVLLDMAMPIMSGRETFYKLKEINPKIKVLIASGFKQDKRVEDTIQAGAHGFIHKPYTLAELAKAFHKIINI